MNPIEEVLLIIALSGLGYPLQSSVRAQSWHAACEWVREEEPEP